MPLKNTRPFAGRMGGLLCIKLRQLAEVSGIDEVVVDSNDPLVLELAEAQRSWWPSTTRLTIRERPDELGQSSTSTDALIEYALATLRCDDLLWTHVTSPMVNGSIYTRAIRAYRELAPEHDSLMSVHRIQTFLWNQVGPANYQREPVRWPRTQDIAPLYAIDSGIFIVPMQLARERHDRIGERPSLFELTAKEAVDVDWEEDFQMAETIYDLAHGPASR